jgi:hypothetical protein
MAILVTFRDLDVYKLAPKQAQTIFAIERVNDFCKSARR